MFEIPNKAKIYFDVVKIIPPSIGGDSLVDVLELLRVEGPSSSLRDIDGLYYFCRLYDDKSFDTSFGPYILGEFVNVRVNMPPCLYDSEFRKIESKNFGDGYLGDAMPFLFDPGNSCLCQMRNVYGPMVDSFLKYINRIQAEKSKECFNIIHIVKDETTIEDVQTHKILKIPKATDKLSSLQARVSRQDLEPEELRVAWQKKSRSFWYFSNRVEGASSQEDKTENVKSVVNQKKKPFEFSQLLESKIEEHIELERTAASCSDERSVVKQLLAVYKTLKNQVQKFVKEED